MTSATPWIEAEGWIGAQGRAVAGDLYQLLRALDPARWQEDIARRAPSELADIHSRIDAMLADARWDQGIPAGLRDTLRALAALLAAAPTSAALKAAWNEFRLALLPIYEELVANLKRLDVHVPSLRPTNYARNLLHLSSGLGVFALIQHALTERTMLVLAILAASAAWGLEISRRLIPRVNDLCMMVLGRFAHPHETWRVNSSTWFATAMLGVALTGEKMLAALAVIILATADPAAAIIGRRFGRIKLINGRSLEGTLAFAVVGTLAGAAALELYYPQPIGRALALAGGAAVLAAAAELLSRRVDDNLSIPLSAAAGAWLVGIAIGL